MVDKILTKKMVNEHIRHRLATNTQIAQQGLLLIYKQQTPMERAFRGQTLEEKNGFGFTAFDSEILSSFAEQMLKRGWLSFRQNEVLRRKMPKYTRQIVEITGEDKIREAIRRKHDSVDSQGGTP